MQFMGGQLHCCIGLYICDKYKKPLRNSLGKNAVLYSALSEYPFLLTTNGGSYC